MPQSLAKILIHAVFSTKDRRPFLREKGLREELHRYLGGILNNFEFDSTLSELVGIRSTLPRVATTSQPWAELLNPFGILYRIHHTLGKESNISNFRFENFEYAVMISE